MTCKTTYFMFQYLNFWTNHAHWRFDRLLPNFLSRQCWRALRLIYARVPFIDCRNIRSPASARIPFCAGRCSCKCKTPRIHRALSSCPPASSLRVGRFLIQRSNRSSSPSTMPSRVLHLSQGFFTLYSSDSFVFIYFLLYSSVLIIFIFFWLIKGLSWEYRESRLCSLVETSLQLPNKRMYALQYSLSSNWEESWNGFLFLLFIF